MTPTSGEADGIRLMRSTSLSARSLTSSGMLASSTFSRSSLTSACCGIVLAELALDGLELLAQDVLALGLVQLRLDLGLDAALELEDLDLAGEEGGDELEALDDVERLEQLLALLGGHVRAVGDHVGQQARLGDVARGDGGLRRDRCARLRRTARSGPGPSAPAPRPRGPPGRRRRAPRPRAEMYGSVDVEAEQAQALLALHDGAHGAVLEPARPGRSWPACRPRRARRARRCPPARPGAGSPAR